MYMIITKIDHGTSHLKHEHDRIMVLKNISNEIYDENDELVKLL